jgi:hypothetical protein
MLRVITAGIFLATNVVVLSGEPPPQFPRVRGDYQMTVEWRVTLPDEYAKRFEEGKLGTNLVLWRSGITCWTSIYNQKVGETPISTLEWRKAETPRDCVQTFELRDTKPLRYGFLLREKPGDDAERWALYTFTFGESGHVQMAIYFDRQQDLEIAKRIWFSITDEPK